MNVYHLSPQKTFCSGETRRRKDTFFSRRRRSCLFNRPNSSSSSSFCHLFVKKGDPPAWVWIRQISVSDQYLSRAMLSVPRLVALLAAVALFSAAEPAAAFAPTASSSSSSSSSNAGRAATSLYVMGPKQAAAMEKLKNPAKYEQTIQGLMAQKGLTRGQAEKRYGEFLADPDGFALAAAEMQRREKGYKDWIEQAMSNSDDPEATLRRIKKFQRVNSFKGTAIMVIAGGLGVWYNYAHPYVPPGH